MTLPRSWNRASMPVPSSRPGSFMSVGVVKADVVMFTKLTQAFFLASPTPGRITSDDLGLWGCDYQKEGGGDDVKYLHDWV